MMPSRENKDVILVKLEMLGDTLPDPDIRVNRQWFYQACYRNHAFATIVKEVKESDKAPSEVIRSFRDRMDKASCDSFHCGFIFSVAVDTADWVLDTLGL